MERGHNRYNVHHTAFYRRIWDSMEYLKRIRGDHRLQVPLDVDVHNDLHKHIDMIPPLPLNLGMRAYAVFNDYGDTHHPADNVENFMRSIEFAMNDPKERELNVGIGHATIWAFEQQLPFIREGAVEVIRKPRRAA